MVKPEDYYLISCTVTTYPIFVVYYNLSYRGVRSLPDAWLHTEFEPVSYRTSHYFFSGHEIAFVNPMYKQSLYLQKNHNGFVSGPLKALRVKFKNRLTTTIVVRADEVDKWKAYLTETLSKSSLRLVYIEYHPLYDTLRVIKK